MDIQKRMDELVTLLNEANYRYYVLDDPKMLDFEYDRLLRELEDLERENPQILNASRKRRVAAGSGTTVQDVNLLLKQFDQARSMMKSMMGAGKRGRMRMPFGKMPKF